METYFNEFFTVIRENVKSIITGKVNEGTTDLNQLGNWALSRVDRITVNPPVKGLPRLTASQKRAFRRFYWPYKLFFTDRYHRLYTAKSGKFYPEYLPEELYLMHVDRYFCDREEARFLDNKCYYCRLLPNTKQPEMVAMRIGQTWLDDQVKPIPFEAVRELVAKESEVVVKRAVNSEGGFGVTFIEGEKLAADLERFMQEIPRDVVIQRPIRQHPDLAKLHPESVNSMRVVSLLTEDKVKVYAVSLKIGAGKNRVDNACRGGMYCGVRSDGSLRKIAVQADGTVLETHPDLGYRFEDQKVPHLDKVIKLVKEAHGFLGHFRMISWDVTVDEAGDAVLVEANLTLGGISEVQICNGPLFGKDTKKILDEVFRRRKR